MNQEHGRREPRQGHGLRGGAVGSNLSGTAEIVR